MIEELQLIDGTRIDIANGKVIRDIPLHSRLVEVPTHKEAQELVINSRRQLSELPAAPKTMNPVSVVLSYTLFGLSTDDIAIATELTFDQVEQIKSGTIYNQYKESVIANVLEADADDLRNLFKQQARYASQTMVELMGSDKEAVALSAAKDILDRAGHRPADTVEHKHSMEDVLKIQYLEPVTVIDNIIDITPK